MFWKYICTYLDECQPRKEDIEVRQKILDYLQNEFVKCYPACRVQIYGSFHNGFGLRNSDLDICIEVNDNVYTYFLSTIILKIYD